MNTDNWQVYTQVKRGQAWLQKYARCKPIFTCTLAFTETALVEGISSAGTTPSARRLTALADAEFLVNGVSPNPVFSLPSLSHGVSPAFITRAVIEHFQLPTYIFNAGLERSPSVNNIDLGGQSARCVSTGKALPLAIVRHLYQQGLAWGKKLAQQAPSSYLVLSECVVAGTTTALAVLTALGIDAQDKVNSSHPICNHQQKWQIVKQGLQQGNPRHDPFSIVAAVGDPMQIFVAAMAMTASHRVGIMLAGGTQMLAVFALIKALAHHTDHPVDLDNIIVGTTRWVAQDPTADSIALAHLLEDISFCATELDFSSSKYETLQIYERGFVKEGVGAGASAISAHLLGVNKQELLTFIEAILSRFQLIAQG